MEAYNTFGIRNKYGTAFFGHFLLQLLSGALTEKCTEKVEQSQATMQIKAGARNY